MSNATAVGVFLGVSLAVIMITVLIVRGYFKLGNHRRSFLFNR